MGRIESVLAIGRDVTEIKKGENELIQLNEQLLEKSGAIEALDGVAGLNFSIFKSIRNDKNEIIDFEWVFASKGQHETLGEKDLVGRQLIEAIPANKTLGLIDKYIEVVSSGKPAKFEIKYTYHGLDYWLDITAVKHGDGFAVMSKNISDRKNSDLEVLRLKDELAQKATDQYLSIFNSIDEGFHLVEVIFDDKGNVVDLAVLEENPAARVLFEESLVGKTIRQVHPEYDPARLQVWGTVAKTGENQRLTRYSDIWKKWFDFHLTRVGGKDSRQVVSIFRDISQQISRRGCT
jgi:PAS domain-containing protein